MQPQKDDPGALISLGRRADCPHFKAPGPRPISMVKLFAHDERENVLGHIVRSAVETSPAGADQAARLQNT